MSTAAAARAFRVEPRYSVLGKGMLRLVGLINGVVRENMEMLYQNDSDYLFDSAKFEKSFDFAPTPYEQGTKETVESMK
jgi:nucleoside-diphosphate-sugar epimerase